MDYAELTGDGFSEWARVAENDPSAFEAMRRAAIEDFICRAPARHQERLRRLQWRIDQERRLARTPMNACIRLSRMMWKSVLGPGGLRDRFDELQQLLQGEDRRPAQPADEPAGRVLSFARTADR